MLFLTLLIVGYHVYILETVCKNKEAECTTFLFVFRFCEAKIIHQILINQGQSLQATLFIATQMSAFIIIILMTIGIKVWLHYLNSNKVEREEKIYSRFSLILKNIPGFYNIEDLRK